MAFNKLLGSCLPYMPEPLMTAAIQRRPWLSNRVPAGRSFRWTRYQGDITVWIDPANPIENSMISGYDNEIVQSVQRFVGPGARCVDVGANVGAVTLLLAKLVGPSGKVLAIEPGPPYQNRLRANLNANPKLRKRVEILPIGISEAVGTLQWIPDPIHPFNASMSQFAYFEEAANIRIPVPIETLDVVTERLGWDRLDFIKIDVEGMELEVFRGAQKTLAKYRPVILFETMTWARDCRREKSNIDIFKEICDLFARIGYRAFKLTHSGELCEQTNFDTWADTNDTLAIPGQ